MKNKRAYSLRKLRAIERAIIDDKFFEDWWPGMDDVIYEDENAHQAVLCFIAELRGLK